VCNRVVIRDFEVEPKSVGTKVEKAANITLMCLYESCKLCAVMDPKL
jgi:hypothetical protein